MKHNKYLIVIASILLSCLCAAQEGVKGELLSPDGNFRLSVYAQDGLPCYELQYKGKPVLKPSKLGFDLSYERGYKDGLSLMDVQKSSFDQTWQPVWGEYAQVRNHYNELCARFEQEGSGRVLLLRFRLFDDGLGFRYEFPEQPTLHIFQVKEELTEFNLAHDYTAYCMPGDYDTNEFTYTTAHISELKEELVNQSLAHKGYEAKSEGGLVIQTPVMLKGDNGLYVNIHEAALVDYPAMELNVDDRNFVFSSNLVPNKNGEKAFKMAPCTTPWRTVIVSDKATDILASRLIYNLNDPCKIEDTSWIHPVKYLGVWWEYFVGIGKTWNYSWYRSAVPGVTDYSTLEPNGHHGATTENVKKYIDFASENGFGGVLVEGWNEGWEDWSAYGRERLFRFDKAYPDFDVEDLQAYASERGVKLIMHHETGSNAVDYERQLDRAFDFMNEHGYDAVKTGYVGGIVPRSEYHASQWMVNHYLYVAQKAAEKHIMVNSHEAVRPTGLCRTWPNWMAQESARGTEFESMGGNPADHTTILPFTRLMGGPMDYTPGIFQTRLDYYEGGYKPDQWARTTLARQLGLYLTMYSPIQMACDLPENYQRFSDAFQFIKDVPVDWEDSRYLEAEPGDYITVARKSKEGGKWFVGCTADENGHTAFFKLDFLQKGQLYKVTVYADAPDAHYEHNPQAYIVRSYELSRADALRIKAAPGGGFAVEIEPVEGAVSRRKGKTVNVNL
ncbi:MAG: glycoside hydrolase family 97 protein [Candidatus Cryptobacteroides sp.]